MVVSIKEITQSVLAVKYPGRAGYEKCFNAYVTRWGERKSSAFNKYLIMGWKKAKYHLKEEVGGKWYPNSCQVLLSP